ncbi:hypothetical protein J3E72DRAFT_292915 [Bipolaris maydis]|uniref:uncharacterized protein n=1 Tax=Cochliobolus heterostrophus TaxID=5016 RepID=UPI0024CF3B86|nr:hypothetical protein J3E73DRAFT_271300 [Bipolaris maydis]KAJ5059994.1 hypothetical protein J3E74DRAFT_340865 [Bipolaris maydis]KAJ6202208.1 hypothetical protein J3E72DRAFT_292915 [Bipolaris maydis]KAJ6210783.1 hypothetical protein PSV09DRAFT_2291623 [Bipolaris maydis]KAJ6273194.1 hypothetical protein PSV08DRAFT_272131 [Bipolaris maydis]
MRLLLRATPFPRFLMFRVPKDRANCSLHHFMFNPSWWMFPICVFFLCMYGGRLSCGSFSLYEYLWGGATGLGVFSACGSAAGTSEVWLITISSVRAPPRSPGPSVHQRGHRGPIVV